MANSSAAASLFLSFILNIDTSGVPPGNRPKTQTILADETEKATLYRRLGPFVLRLNQRLENGDGSCITKSVPYVKVEVECR